MNIASDWAVRIKAFHEKQLDRPRRVYPLGRTKILLTRGQIVSTLGATFGAVSVDSPDWLFWLAAVGCRRKVFLPGSAEQRGEPVRLQGSGQEISR